MEKNKETIDIEEIINEGLICLEEGKVNVISENYIRYFLLPEYANKLLDYTINKIGDEIEVDYNVLGRMGISSERIEVFVKRGSLEEIKESIKKDLGI